MSSPRFKGTIVAANDVLTLSVMGLAGVAIQITGTFSGTLQFECSIDGINFRSLNATPSNSSTPVTSATNVGLWLATVSGVSVVRIRASAWASGTAEVMLQASEAGPGGAGGSGGGGEGAILDGADPGIKATVFDLTNSNPVAVRQVDANGDPLSGSAVSIADGDDAALGATTDAEAASGDGTLIAIAKRIRTLLAGGLPAALSGGGGVKVGVVDALPAGTNNIGDVDVLTVPADPFGANADAASATGSISAKLRRMATDLVALVAQALDYDTGAGTSSVQIFGIALPGAGGPVAGGTSTNPLRTDPTGTTTQPVSAASLPLPTGAATLAEQQAQSTLVGAVDETAPASDTANSGLNGRLQRVAQRLTSLIALLPAAFTSGGGVKTGLVDALPAGTNNIGDVDVLTLPTLKYQQVYGTPQTVIDTGTDIAAGNFSGAPSATFDNTSDAAVPNAPYAKVMAEFPDWGAAPAAGTVVELWGVLKDTDGTDDDTDAPSGTSSGGARLFGFFPIAAADALQRRTITISLDGCEKIDFYIKNGTAQNMNNDGGTNCVLKVTPFTFKVAA